MEPVCPSHILCVPVWGFAGADLPDIPMSPGASKSAGEAANWIGLISMADKGPVNPIPARGRAWLGQTGSINTPQGLTGSLFFNREGLRRGDFIFL